MKKNIFDDPQIWNWVDSNDDNQVRYEFTEKLTPADVSSILDIGCGHGRFLKLISAKRNDLRCVGADYSEGALEYVPFEKVQASITSIPYPDHQFDCVYAMEVLEHLNPVEFETALQEMVRLTKKYIIVSVPYKENLESNMTRCPVCHTIYHYDGHIQNFDEQKIKGLFDKYGFVCKTWDRLGWTENYKYHDLYVKMFYPEQKYKTKHYTVCPVCNTEIKPQQQSGPNTNTIGTPQAGGLIRNIKNGIKNLWPRESKSYWIIGLYEKI
ncbi:MAG: class I SAM-dependent methyltransferase [Bacteroidetes bacterium]|nr:class I SAM-dependent methyltransferase [Bacteroidota bacterium]